MRMKGGALCCVAVSAEVAAGRVRGVEEEGKAVARNAARLLDKGSGPEAAAAASGSSSATAKKMPGIRVPPHD